MIRTAHFITVISTLLFSHIALANSEFSQETLQNLFKSQQRQAAYDYANKYLGQMEGDAYFDYVYGVSAIDTGHASQGVFALERVLLTFSEDHVARLELARGYFILEEYARSRQEFETVLQTEPPEGVIQTTQAYLDKIRLKEARYKTTSNGYIELGLGTDTNVNSSPTQGNLIVLSSFGIQLNDTSLEQDDTFTNLTAAWQTTHPFAPGWMFNAGITGAFRKNSDFDQFDSMTATAQLGITNIYKYSRYKIELVAQQYDLDSDTYRNLAGLNLEWRYAISQKSSLTSIIQLAELDYPDPSLDIRNSSMNTVNVSYNHLFSGSLSPTLFVSFNGGTENAESDSPSALSDTERDILGARLGLVLSLSQKLALQTTASIQNSQYAGSQVNPLFPGITREDDYITADANLLWLYEKDLRLDTKISYSQNSSNVELYEYDRIMFSVNLNYAF